MLMDGCLTARLARDCARGSNSRASDRALRRSACDAVLKLALSNSDSWEAVMQPVVLLSGHQGWSRRERKAGIWRTGNDDA
jgi:hypothetical protein